MSPTHLETPILFCIFNRPELTHRVFQVIARQRPRTLLIAGDGPRIGNTQDEAKVTATRRICELIDWPCQLHTLFPEQNQGCRKQMATAINWAFQQFERVIVLEDDCLPDDSFFPFCEELLDRYADQPRVTTICGVNHLCESDSAEVATADAESDSSNFSNPPFDYRFSKYPLIWGWASWRRAWQHYDLEMAKWNDSTIAAAVLQRSTESPAEYAYWHSIFSQQAAGEIDTWDYSWTFASWLNNGLTIVPAKNLISNLGFGPEATHTKDSTSPFANLPARRLHLSRHPLRIERDVCWDRLADQYYFPRPTLDAQVDSRSDSRPHRRPRWQRWLQKLRLAAG